MTSEPQPVRAPHSPHITVTQYNESDVSVYDLLKIDQFKRTTGGGLITWIDIDGTEDDRIIEKLCDDFGLHEALLQEVGASELRPKVEDMGTHMHIVLQMMRHAGTETGVISEKVHVLLGPDFVISVQEGQEGDVFDPVRLRLRENRGSIRRQGPDYLVYAMFEAVIDNYFVVLEEIGEVVEDMQDEMLESPSTALLRKMRDMKRNVRQLRKSVWPLREVIGEMEREDSPLINDANNVHFRRAYEHTIQAVDVAEAAREVLSDMLDIYLSSVSNKLNQVMKTLTIITTIFMPLSFIAGLYGMNFRFMPELNWRMGYPLTLSVMGIIVLIMLIVFKRNDWL